ncbi:hypothetical protein [Bradyrhizobium symbiodeficiens]|uniref:Uncharacterized protein n=1 Tax=Bradyrhizobium symbiodeficiens TaxID=1404367 RepID=A0ABX5W0V4_9BRAD|nr:hypothetical protein [Bradyrhizobium symbiodeficiens]QDF36241.1 hypothetical protein FJN17_00940 [Bradyrhizobium symbiodeficiens]
MRLVLVLLFMTTSAAYAQNCQQGYYPCGQSELSSGRNGGTTNWSDGDVSRRFGSTSYNSNGTTFQTYGNNTYFDNGATAQSYGNTTVFSNGRSCQRFGNNLFCN